MTIEQWATRELIANGMFESQAAEVIEMVKTGDRAMIGRWNDDASGYPPALFNVLWLTIRRVALDWIVANKPLAWYRPMFEDVQP